MSNLEELIERLCPDGVEYKTLGEICDIFTGGDLPKNCIKGSVSDKEHPYPVWGNGKEVYGFADKFKIAEDAVVISSIGANTGSVYFHKAFFTPIIRLKVILPKKDNILIRYIYHYLSNIKIKSKSSSVPNMNASEIKAIKIPVPPLEVQREIVRILDNFTFLTTELAAELAARQKQYEYYRDLLLTFKPNESTILDELELSGAIRWMKLGDTCLHSCSGATPKKSNSEYYTDGTIPWIRTQDVVFNSIYKVDAFITEKAVQETGAKWIPENCVIVAISGASAGRCAINKIKATTNQHCLNMEIDSSKALYKYVFYCLCNQHEELLLKKQGARGDLNSSLILGMRIPVPPLEQQQRIVDILDRFDTLCNDISSGLPAEIEMRQKQYEYYRDKLLTFKELKKEA